MKVNGFCLGVGLFAMVSMNASLINGRTTFGLIAGLLGVLNIYFAFCEKDIKLGLSEVNE